MISFNDVRLLSYNHQHNYFGENLNFQIQKHLIIEGSIYNLNNSSGVAGVWQGISGLVSTAIDYDSIIINGTNFGQGRINSFNFQQGIDVRIKQYSIDLTVFNSGNFYNMTGADFSGINLPNIHLTENFGESFDFNIAEDGTYSYKQNIKVKYINGGGIGDSILAAKQLASGLLFSTPTYGFIDSGHSGFYNQPGKRIYTENYNKITNECAFVESFTQAESRGTYAIKYVQEINTALDGISTVSENGHIEGLLQNDFMGSAQSGLNDELVGGYARAAVLLSTYVVSGRPLNLSYISLQKKINQFNNTIDYTVHYNNDPRNQNTYSWDYTQDIQRGADTCYYTIKENGTVRGITADCSRASQFNNANAAWNSIVKPSITGRMNSYYTNITNLSNTLKLVSTQEKDAAYQGQISYDYTYTDDLTFLNNQAIKRIEIQVTDDLPVPAVNHFLVGGVGEIIQDLGIAKEARRTVNIKMFGKRGTDLSVYLNSGKSSLNSLIPTGQDVYINGCEYSFSPPENSFDIKVDWIYFGSVGGIAV